MGFVFPGKIPATSGAFPNRRCPAFYLYKLDQVYSTVCENSGSFLVVSGPNVGQWGSPYKMKPDTRSLHNVVNYVNPAITPGWDQLSSLGQDMFFLEKQGQGGQPCVFSVVGGIKGWAESGWWFSDRQQHLQAPEQPLL